MGRGLLLWLLGVPIPVIILLWLFFGRWSADAGPRVARESRLCRTAAEPDFCCDRARASARFFTDLQLL